MTIYEIAQRCGVSTATVSRVLNDRPGVNNQTRARVLAVCQEVGFTPSTTARGLSMKRSWMIGVVWRQAFTHLLFQEIFAAFDDAVHRHGYDLLIFSHERHASDLELLAERVRSRNLDGLVLTGITATDPGVAALQKLDVPMVLINVDGVFPRAGRVVSDNYQGGALAARHLYEQGHRDMAVVAYRDWAPVYQRFVGFSEELRRLGVSLPSDRVVFADWTEEGGAHALRKLLGQAHPPTAVFCVSDLQAVGALWAALDAGVRVPEDLSLIGFDDILLTRYVRPRLSTIRQDTATIGRVAAEELLRLMSPDATPRERVVPTRLIERESVAPPRTDSGRRTTSRRPRKRVYHPEA
jgi:LacI family transcriptional regulator